MALSNFFRLNLPYGIDIYNDGRIATFNREYHPIGFLKPSPLEPVHFRMSRTKVKNLIPQLTKAGIYFNEIEGGYRVYFYNDATNPSDYHHPELWDMYFKCIKLISNIQVL